MYHTLSQTQPIFEISNFRLNPRCTLSLWPPSIVVHQNPKTQKSIKFSPSFFFTPKLESDLFFSKSNSNPLNRIKQKFLKNLISFDDRVTTL